MQIGAWHSGQGPTRCTSTMWEADRCSIVSAGTCLIGELGLLSVCTTFPSAHRGQALWRGRTPGAALLLLYSHPFTNRSRKLRGTRRRRPSTREGTSPRAIIFSRVRMLMPSKRAVSARLTSQGRSLRVIRLFTAISVRTQADYDVRRGIQCTQNGLF